MKHKLTFPPIFEPSEHGGSGFEASAIFSEHVPIFLPLSHP